MSDTSPGSAFATLRWVRRGLACVAWSATALAACGTVACGEAPALGLESPLPRAAGGTAGAAGTAGTPAATAAPLPTRRDAGTSDTEVTAGNSDAAAARDAGARGGGAGVGGAAPGGAAEGTAPPNAGGTRTPLAGFELAVIGSSTAAGEGASSEADAWVGLLDASLEASVTGSFSLVNHAIGGHSSAELLPASGSPGNLDDALAERPDLIVVALAGGNDLSSGTSTTEFMARLGVLRDTAMAQGIAVFFLSTAPKDLSTGERELLDAWATRMGEVLGSCWVPDQNAPHSPCFVDVFHALADDGFGLHDAFDSGDGIHLNDAGHARIFELARGVIAPYVCSRTTCR